MPCPSRTPPQNPRTIGTEYRGPHLAHVSPENHFQFAGMRVPNASGAVVRRGYDVATVGTEHGEMHGFGVPRKNQADFCPDIPDPGRPIIGCGHHAPAVTTQSNAPHVCAMFRKSIDRLALVESPQTHGLVCGGRHQQET